MEYCAKGVLQRSPMDFGYYLTEASLENNIKTEMQGEEMELPNIVNYWYGLNVIYQTVPTMHEIQGIYPGFFGRDNPLFHHSIIPIKTLYP